MTLYIKMVGQLAVPVYHTYGMTETATHIALRRLNGPERSDAFVPLPGVELALDDRGCLAIRGAVTAGAWLQTNDIVDLRSDGSFVWLGRWDNVINTGGIKVQIEQVEAAVAACQAQRHRSRLGGPPPGHCRPAGRKAGPGSDAGGCRPTAWQCG